MARLELAVFLVSLYLDKSVLTHHGVGECATRASILITILSLVIRADFKPDLYGRGSGRDRCHILLRNCLSNFLIGVDFRWIVILAGGLSQDGLAFLLLWRGLRL